MSTTRTADRTALAASASLGPASAEVPGTGPGARAGGRNAFDFIFGRG